ncbi:hypothetical protein TRFO_32457 [Tritrichomonas foetus]|uniref:Right handed beta helix domain-containing protein n=1 Tax=Tritrichomonas foetus TaxID=1144522 RepID=A0A1J4JU07_9EUKA|nr:hypothetical protein TRFO_32457 [Tritrichomonas foetus]|eukprot:OHT00733.1 hypothetical protein TRFO_32457 [Tritrichomonas foetus]
MLNLTFTALSINHMMRNSPMFALTSKVNFHLQSSHFSHFSSPIIYTISQPRTSIRFDKLLITNPLTSLANCKTLTSTPSENNIYSGCVTATDTTFTFQDTVYYELTGANFTVTNCIFTDISGVEVLFELENTFIDFQNSTVSNCPMTFMNAENPTIGSKFVNTTFYNDNVIFKATEGGISFTRCSFNRTVVTRRTDGTFNYIDLDSCLDVSFTDCTFTDIQESIEQNVSAIYASNTISLKIDNCNFNTIAPVTTMEKSYVMVLNSCFRASSDKAITGIANQIVLGGTNNFEKTCPYVLPTATMTSEKRAYAITTVVVFSLFFAALFITLIALVFCKAEEEKVEYGKLHEDGIPEDNTDSQDRSD